METSTKTNFPKHFPCTKWKCFLFCNSYVTFHKRSNNRSGVNRKKAFKALEAKNHYATFGLRLLNKFGV